MTPVDHGEFERIRDVLASAGIEEPLSASEIVAVLDERGVDVDSTHRVATVLGRRAESGAVEVVGEDPPYRYRFVGE
ncbi:hypothetical protein [Halorubellus sp. PRR65]|uniref:hypothetical protein n=1 Tax=Halorubellus sp. PRR65 TaxID=3098148 RepID=UPI002B25A69F|nr:hypothetical protein [Halorubellus sp. PRR65]